MEFKIVNQGRVVLFEQKMYELNIAFKKYINKYCFYNKEKDVYIFDEKNNIPKNDFLAKIQPFLKENKHCKLKTKNIFIILLLVSIVTMGFFYALLNYKNQTIYNKYTSYSSKVDLIKNLGFPTSIIGSKTSDTYYYSLSYHENSCKLVFNVNNNVVISETKYNKECVEYFFNKYK